ncbi:MAG: inosamine-phosphate amidinotransferase 1 [Gammaproteobacteria bacterium]|nr:inosamine-phosphate amidinotransferase 1 [Gammaproteobacteria bacterium]
MSLVCVYNEWDPIEEIIVGSSLGAAIPHKDKGFQAMQRSTDDLFDSLALGPFPQKIIEETEEDIENFIVELKKLNITVQRPTKINSKNNFKTLDWESEHYFSYCPRDIMLAIGDMIIETPNVFQSRYFETFEYKEILLRYMQSGTKWISAPKPRLTEETYNTHNFQQLALNNIEPVFDAANILRAGTDLFYLVSDSGNELGCQWLQNILGKDFTVHPCHNLYSSMHIDSTISLLRPGLALVNPSRVNDKNLPPMLKQWDIIVAPEMADYKYSDYGTFSTVWLGMNFLMLSPTLAVVDQHQKALIKLLESHGIDVLPLLLRHGRTLGGGFHCITLDVRRKGTLESYFS